MYKENKILRVKRSEEISGEWTFKIYLTTYKEFLQSNYYIVKGVKTELKPYRWYEIQRLWTIPTYLLFWFFKRPIYKNPFTKLEKQSKRHNTIVVLMILGFLLTLFISYQQGIFDDLLGIETQ